MPRTADHSHVAPGLAQRLREARGQLKMRELANAVGVTTSYISRIEKGERVPTLQLLNRLADQLGVSREWLATGQAGGTAADELRVLRTENEQLRRVLRRIRGHVDDVLSPEARS
jgi:transcriptional regulator with XRE-family HTH domain